MKTKKALILLVFAATCCLVFADARKNNQSIESLEIIAFNTQFNYEVLELVRSNQIDKARSKLEMKSFLELELIWELVGIEGISKNKACRETFIRTYPSLRKTVQLEQFGKFPLQERSNLTNFVKEVDPVFLAK